MSCTVALFKHVYQLNIYFFLLIFAFLICRRLFFSFTEFLFYFTSYLNDFPFCRSGPQYTQTLLSSNSAKKKKLIHKLKTAVAELFSYRRPHYTDVHVINSAQRLITGCCVISMFKHTHLS